MTKSADALALKVAQAFFTREGIAPQLGIVIEEVREGYARLSMVVRPEMLNGHRTAHGGLIFTLADTAFAYACNSRNQNAVGQQVSITYLRAGALGEKLTAEARETALAGRSGTYHITVRGEDGAVVADLLALCRLVGGTVIEPEPATGG